MADRVCVRGALRPDCAQLAQRDADRFAVCLSVATLCLELRVFAHAGAALKMAAAEALVERVGKLQHEQLAKVAARTLQPVENLVWRVHGDCAAHGYS